MTKEQKELVREGRMTAQMLYARNLNCVSANKEENDAMTAVAGFIDRMCDELEGCDSSKSFFEHFTVLAGGKCWWSEDVESES